MNGTAFVKEIGIESKLLKIPPAAHAEYFLRLV
jgi:hypothetical protein